MRPIITIALFFLLCRVSAQNPTIDSIYRYNPWYILQGFHYNEYKPIDIYKLTGEYPFQWFSYVIHGAKYAVQNIAINIMCNREELDVLMKHKWKLSKDLYNMFMEAPVESFELTQIGGQRFALHRPGQSYPMYRYFKILESEGHCQLGLLDNGWHVRLIDGGVPGTRGKTPIAIKETKPINGERTWLVSVALFMRIYYGDLLDPRMQNISADIIHPIGRLPYTLETFDSLGVDTIKNYIIIGDGDGQIYEATPGTKEIIIKSK